MAEPRPQSLGLGTLALTKQVLIKNAQVFAVLNFFLLSQCGQALAIRPKLVVFLGKTSLAKPLLAKEALTRFFH